MSVPISKEEKVLLQKIIKNPIAFKLLQDKARWEAMTLSGTLQEWGDPRKWREYKEQLEMENKRGWRMKSEEFRA